MGALRPLIWRGDRVECPCCGGRFERFLPYWNRDFCRCPRCDSHERHRALWLYLRDRADLAGTLLHLAPEAAIARHLRDRPGVDYVSADLDSPLAMLHFDIQDIPFRDGTFDARALRARADRGPRRPQGDARDGPRAAPGGWAIVMAAVEPGRAQTYEDPAITDPEARRAAFLEPHNVRVYGADLADRLREAGFAVEVIRPSGRSPLVIAVTICCWVQFPRPVSGPASGSGRLDEHAMPWNAEAYIRAAEIPGKVEMAEKVARRMTVAAAADLDEVLSALHLRFGRARRSERRSRHDSGHDKTWQTVRHSHSPIDLTGYRNGPRLFKPRCSLLRCPTHARLTVGNAFRPQRRQKWPICK